MGQPLAESRKSRQNPAVRDFILRTIPAHPVAVGTLVTEKFGLSRTSANRYLKRLEAEGLITASGKTSARRYELKTTFSYFDTVAILPSTSESELWRTKLEPLIKNIKHNVFSICEYGFSEIMNNVIDHSGSSDANIEFNQDYLNIRMDIVDHGVGIFEKIKKDFGLDDPRSALLELSKGKLTSDKSRHSGEGIFFTSRMFNRFSILSGSLFYSRELTDDWGWLIESHDRPAYTQGTHVQMIISADATWTAKEIFDKYQNEEMDFAKTHVPLKLGKYAHEQLISRSQAKRVLARFERFEEVLLDFRGVDEIGQAFADEIFRVFSNAHPNIKIIAINTSPDVDKMIRHAQSANPSSPSDYRPPGSFS